MFFSQLIKGIGPTDRVLEIGPGGTPHPRADIFLDLDPKLFKNAEEAEYQRGKAPALETEKEVVFYDGGKFPFKDKSFDYVICSHVLEHVEDVSGFLNELFRITDKGYIEFPTILYDYIYDIPVHPNFLIFNEKGELLWMKKSESSFSDFRDVQAFFRESVIQGHDCLIQSLEKSMIQGFEWSKPFKVRKARTISSLVPPLTTLGKPLFTHLSQTLPQATVPDVVYKPLNMYPTKDVAKELLRRIDRKVLRRHSHEQQKNGISENSQTISQHLIEDMEFYSRIKKPVDSEARNSNSSSPVEDRFLDKAWGWLADRDHDPTHSWVYQWMESHPIGKIGAQNVVNRELWLEKTLRNIPKGKNILDAGAGELQYKRFCKHLKYTSQDFGQYTGEGNNSGLQTGSWDNSKLDIVSDILSIPVKDSSFDAIMCVEVFEHIPKPVEALKEFSRILKKNGHLILTAPFACLTHFAPYFYYNGFSQYFYRDLLEDLGFEIIDLNLNGNYFEYLAQEIRRFEGVGEQYAGDAKKASAIESLSQHVLLRRIS